MEYTKDFIPNPIDKNFLVNKCSEKNLYLQNISLEEKKILDILLKNIAKEEGCVSYI